MVRSAARGLLAGATGTVVLNLVTYGDMAWRGRPSSGMPAETADRLAGHAGIELGDGEEKASREEAAGALLGYVAGLGTGLLYGLLRAAATVRCGSPVPCWPPRRWRPVISRDRPRGHRPEGVERHGVAVRRRTAPGLRVHHRRRLRGPAVIARLAVRPPARRPCREAGVGGVPVAGGR
ncbi:hypothetical protein [Streptomyces sp. C8S0]|uniref:hypothetical protein n=1 Tax=Streptomyces sp. C8S0 TaxID=2585716 RepID=UPI00299F56AA|nr:hypothetical protein [Streptomyces sp. C8S0]